MAERASNSHLVFPLPLLALPVTYDSLPKIGQVSVPLLVVRGETDELIHFAQGRSLFEAASEPKTLYPVRDAGHSDASPLGEKAYFRQLATFVGSLVGR